ncbi:MAG: helix-turn-helix domain-containing protein [Patescibacteria group bacterium]
MKKERYISIGEASKLLDVSIMTLRRWDESGRLVSVRKQPKGNRYYRREDVEILTSDLLQRAQDWVISGKDIKEEYYSRTSDIFQARLVSMEKLLMQDNEAKQIFSLLVSVTGEIGNNSFDHNLGQWPDVPGTFFGYDIEKKQIVLADRGLGVLATLKRVKTGLRYDKDALKVAFTEIVSGRAPESRGNGLKYVRQVVSQNPINLFFQSGNAKLQMLGGGNELNLVEMKGNSKGCIAFITY